MRRLITLLCLLATSGSLVGRMSASQLFASTPIWGQLTVQAPADVAAAVPRVPETITTAARARPSHAAQRHAAGIGAAIIAEPLAAAWQPVAVSAGNAGLAPARRGYQATGPPATTMEMSSPENFVARYA